MNSRCILLTTFPAKANKKAKHHSYINIPSGCILENSKTLFELVARNLFAVINS